MSLDQGTGFSGAWIHGGPESPDGPGFPTLEVWFNASTLAATLANNDPVDAWADDTGNGHGATAAGAGRPLFQTGILGGQPGLLFDGANNFMTIGSAISRGASASMSTIVVIQPQGAGATRTMIGSGAATVMLRRTNDEVIFSNGANFISNPFSAFTTPLAVFWTVNANAWECYENLTAKGSGVGFSGAFSYGLIGQRNGGSERWNGHIMEILHYNGHLTSGQRTSLWNNYLGPKYFF